MTIPTGIAIEPVIKSLKCKQNPAFPDSYVGLVFGRSGFGVKHGVTLANSVGVIDCDYRGEVGVTLINHGDKPFVVTHGDRIAQLAFMPVAAARFVEAASLSDTERGAGGFGSTGTR